jgi:hypothetical protein
MDIMYWEDETILLLIDEAIKWEMGEIIPNRLPKTLMESITRMWLRVFGPMVMLITDQEGAMTSESVAVWCERWNISLKLRPRDAHPPVIERHHEILRDLLHKIKTQLSTEGILLAKSDIVAEALYAKNCLVTVDNFAPYVGLLGRQPRLLSELETPTISADADDEGGEPGTSRHAVRLREIAVEAMVASVAKNRLSRAANTKTRRAGELEGLEPGMMVEIYRTPANKDLTGWRGPAVVVSTHNITDGWIDVRWQGRVMSARIPEVRKCTTLLAYFLGAADRPLELIRRTVLNLIGPTFITCGWIVGPQGWLKTRYAIEHPEVYNAVLITARSALGLWRCVGARMGRNGTMLHGMTGLEV